VLTGALVLAMSAVVLNPAASGAAQSDARAAAPMASSENIYRDAYPDAARSYLLARDGVVLAAREPNLQRAPASLTKLLTALVILEDDHWNAEAWLPVSATAAAIPPTRAGLRAGEQITAGAALAAMLVRSANDACRVLVERVSPDIATFSTRMNARARALGMSSSHFVDPCGFDAAGQHSTAVDLLTLAQAAHKAPLIATFTAMPSVQIKTKGGRTITLANTNQLIGRLNGTAGMKTGYTAQAGQCLIAYVRRADREVWLVMLGGSERWWLAHGMIEDAFRANRAD
jgi:serine-type D-Ala-D-Ala carboxypeptidase (penicillin-binding protein 5/6)